MPGETDEELLKFDSLNEATQSSDQDAVPSVPAAPDDWFIDGNFVIRHHHRPRKCLYDPEDDGRVNFSLTTKRVTCGVSRKTGTAFRIEDNWKASRPVSDDPDKWCQLKAQERLRRDSERNPRHARLLAEGWTGMTVFYTNG